MLRNTPIKRKVTAVILMTSTTVLLFACAAFFAYDLLTFRQSMVAHLSTLAQMTAATSTAALAFDNPKDAEETLSALRAEPDIAAACLYDKDGSLFATYPARSPADRFPARVGPAAPRFQGSFLVVFQPAMQNGVMQGTLYLKSSLAPLYQRIYLYSIIVFVVMAVSFVVAFLLSNVLQKQISRPVLALAETAKAVALRQDYSVRAPTTGRDEFGLLTDAFNDMLVQIHNRDLALQDAQQELRRHAGELEKRVAERTARLSETVGELEAFSYSIAHDMRAPLRALQGYGKLLGDEYADKLDDDGRNYLRRITASALRMDLLIQDVLNYSKVARAELPLEPVDLEKLLRGILESYPMFHEGAGILLQTPFPEVLGNEAALTQCFSNLLGNAVKFVAPGVTPRVRVWSESRGEYVAIFLQDNGIGIAPDQYEKIFAIFQRINKGYEGTGIGLAIVKKAVERMGGRVGVESKAGQGSTFWIELRSAVR